MDVYGLSPENLRLALWSCFPSVEIFHEIKGEQGNISFISRLKDLAFEKKLIEKNSSALFEELVRTTSELHKGRRPSQEFTFDSLLAQIKKERSIKSLVAELKEMAKDLGMEGPDEVLFTRMKKDSHAGSLKRRHALLLLCLWLSMNKPEFALNYANLTGFPRDATDVSVDESMGVLAVFAFMGENIDAATVYFLKKELPVCIKDLKLTYLSEKRLTFLATTCMARFPVTQGAPGLPPTYGQAMRDALSLAYQVMVTWQLSQLQTSRLSLYISIDAGEFASIEIMIKELMSPDLPPESPIRLSHFAYTAARQADLKVVFKPIKYPNVWSAQNFWSFPYFKNPPMLMPKTPGASDAGDILPVTDENVREFREALFITDSKNYGILPVVHNYPPKILASLEVAHVTTLRRLHHEAIQVLSYVLSFDPLNHIARTLRLHNLMALATCSKDIETADILFDRATHDGGFIERYCIPDPEFYSEYCLVYWARAIKLIKLMRKGVISEDVNKTMAYVIELLRQGEECAKKGLAASTSGTDSRCGYWLLYCLAFRRLLEKDPDLMRDISRPMEDRHDLFPKIFNSFIHAGGWVPPMDSTGTVDEGFMDRKALHSTGTYLNSLSSTYQYPHAAFGVCNFMWDFSGPERKRLLIDQILLFLDIIRMKIEELKPLCLGTYSATASLIEIQSPTEYITCIERAKTEVAKIKETGSYDTGMKLLMLNFDYETGTSPITFDLIRKEDEPGAP